MPTERPDRDSTSLSLLYRVRAGDPGAWQRLVALYTPLVAHWGRRAGLQPADVDDVTQEVFAAVADSLDRFRKDRPHDTFRGWLRGVARNKLLEFARRVRDRPAAVGGSTALIQLGEVPQPADPAESPGDDVGPFAAVVRAALDRIRPEFQATTWAAFWQATADGRAVADVAADLRLSPNAVRVARCRVLRRLREELGDLEPADPAG